ncbi:MAG: glycosyltransferase [Syntrophus sp. (in: bacteria)]
MSERLPFNRRGLDVTIYPQAKIIQPERISIGNHVIIDDFCFIVGGQKTEIGDYVHLASYVSHTGAGELTISDFCQVAQGTCFLTGTDDFTGVWGGIPSPTIPPKYRFPKRSFIMMEKHAMIGQGSRIMPGVTLGEGCAIGSMSLVLKDMPPWTICTGIPAKPIRERKRDLVLKCEEGLRKDNERPLVSICCLTYNQEKFIRQTLDGFLMQKTSFDFEVLVHDDASTDGTQAILREYEQRHPGIVKLIIQPVNLYSKTGIYPIMNLYRAAKGKYIAECDGDDYWTDPRKLQRQADFLEANPDYAMCHHDYQIFQDGVFKEPSKGDAPKDFTALELIGYTGAGYGIGVMTRMFRNRYSAETAADIEAMVGDYPTIVYMGTVGKCKFIEGVAPSVYRRKHGTNSWCSLPPNEMARRTAEMHKRIYDWFLKRGSHRNIEIRKGFVEVKCR